MIQPVASHKDNFNVMTAGVMVIMVMIIKQAIK
jgi:hypothetical protein